MRFSPHSTLSTHTNDMHNTHSAMEIPLPPRHLFVSRSYVVTCPSEDHTSTYVCYTRESWSRLVFTTLHTIMLLVTTVELLATASIALVLRPHGVLDVLERYVSHSASASFASFLSATQGVSIPLADGAEAVKTHIAHAWGVLIPFETSFAARILGAMFLLLVWSWRRTWVEQGEPC